jgi:hypothetical protein
MGAHTTHKKGDRVMYIYEYGGFRDSGDFWIVVNSMNRQVALTKTREMARRVAKGLNLEREYEKKKKEFRL